MPKTDFDALYRLHKVDALLHDIRRRAAVLDVGQAAQKAIEGYRPEYDAAVGAARAVEAELQDVGLRRQSRADKLKRLDKDLYGGKVVNPREIELLQKEVETLKEQQDEAELAELELMDRLPALLESAREAELRMKALHATLAAKRQAALKLKGELEAEYLRAQQTRPTAAKAVRAEFLAQYEAILKRTNGVAMAEVTPSGGCSRCRTQLPTKTILAAKESKWVTCEECHRILIVVDAE